MSITVILFKIVQSRYFPILLLTLLPFLLFWKATSGHYVFAVGDLSGSDLLEMHLPFKQILHDSYTQFSFPLWTPYLSNGFPILAEGQSGPLYLPHIILAFLPAHIGLNYSILLAFALAGVGGFIYARTLPKMSLFGAFCVGLLFMFSSFFVARIKHLNMIIVAAYLPWSFYFIRRFFLTTELRNFIYLGFIWSLQLFAGHPHMFYLCLIMSGWYAAGELGRVYFFRKMLQKGAVLWFSLCTLVGIALALAIAIGLAAAQLLPTYELTQLSTRQQFTFPVATDFPLRPNYLASLFAPFFLGNPAAGTYKGDIHTDGIWWENVFYIGLLPFVLCILLLFVYLWRIIKRFAASSRRSSIGLTESVFRYYLTYFAVTLLLFYLLAMGSYTPLFAILYDNLPGMQLFRFPNRFILFTIFCACNFSGWGVTRMIERLMRSRTQNAHKTNDSEYTFSWPFSLSVTYVLISVVLLVDLSVFAYQYISFFPVKDYLAKPKSLELFQKDPDLFRIYPTSQYAGQNPFSAIGWTKGEKAINSLQIGMPGNFPAYYRLFSFTDRGWFEGGLGVKERFLVENIALKNELPSSVLGQLLGFWNVKYFITFAEIGSSDFVELAKYQLDKAFGVPLFVYRNEHVMPRAFFVKKIEKVQNEQRVVERLLTASSSAYLTAFEIDSAAKEASTSAILENSDEFIRNNAVIVRGYAANRVEMITKSKDGGYVIFSDTYYPGWKAFVDGKETPIKRVNLIQRAVPVDPGEHKIIWTYTPFVFYSGLGISIATVTTVACALWLGKGRKGRVVRGKGSVSPETATY